MPRFTLFRRPHYDRLPRSVREEIDTICTARQLEHLALSSHMRADIGLDCGCDDLPFRERHLP